MRKQITILFLVMGTLLLAACAETTTTVSKQDEQNNDKKSVKVNKSTTGDKKEQGDKQKTVTKPFKAIKPPEDAKLLETNYSDEEKEKMPDQEAHGEESARTVSLGQTLLQDKKDTSNGPLKDHRLVAFYGTPKSENMGILGEYPPDEMMKKLKEQTEEYSKIDPDRPAIPTIELIATVAQRSPGPDGLYVAKPSKEVIDEYAKLAEEHDALLLLDIQLGRAEVMDELKKVAPYLKLPHVHLAIDTEYSVGEGEIPGEDLGEVDGEDIQEAVEYVDKLVEENNLPDKIVLVHQFGNGIVTNKEKIKPTKHVEVPLNYDGFGDPAIKMSAYGKLVRKQPIQYGGFKLFYKNDDPLLSPEDVLKLDPAPAVIDYQ
ncbi:hypothetical protein ABRT01_01315 [Lentibacillus sp. L22]|uniref:hypothetical protein n=1 Tax=Lentibacillus TaxID=175304 RepID=UPI0022B0F76A|nr:hypothetical protein [Lentibacillus daqui]